ncbi:hypothetical protein QOT17_018174 [Balamuthia mandrillaris]
MSDKQSAGATQEQQQKEGVAQTQATLPKEAAPHTTNSAQTREDITKDKASTAKTVTMGQEGEQTKPQEEKETTATTTDEMPAAKVTGEKRKLEEVKLAEEGNKEEPEQQSHKEDTANDGLEQGATGITEGTTGSAQEAAIKSTSESPQKKLKPEEQKKKPEEQTETPEAPAVESRG